MPVRSVSLEENAGAGANAPRAGRTVFPPLPADLAPDLAEALAADPATALAFGRLPPSHRREHLKYIDEAKKPETRRLRIARTVGRLKEADVPGAQAKRDHGQA